MAPFQPIGPIVFLLVVGLLSISCSAMRFNVSGEFTILQFTDLHFCETDALDLKSQQLQRNMLNWVRPDLVVFSGDGASGYGPGSKEPGWFKKCWERFTGPVVDYQVPYIYTLGNHDSEGELNRIEIIQLDSTSKWSLRNASDGIPDTANFYVPIFSSRNESELAANVWVFDSGREGCMGTHNEGWGCIEPDVLDWYDNTSQKIKQKYGTNVHHVAYYHIPIPEYVSLYNGYATYGVGDEGVGCPVVNTGFFDRMKKNGDITANFVGHDHYNDYGGWIDGIELMYGRKSGYGGYGNIRGARVLVLNENYDDQGELSVTRVSYVIYENGTKEFDTNPIYHNNTKNGCSLVYTAAAVHQTIQYIYYLLLGNAQKSDSSLQTGINAYTTPMLRGAKKKKGPEGPAEAESNDIINIFKDKTDPEIKPIEEYPVWLVELLDFKKNTDTVLHGMMHGLKHDHPQTYDLRTLMNHMRRRRITDMNRFTAFEKADFEKRDPLDWNMESIIKAADEEAVQQEEEEEEEGDEE